VYSRNLYSGLGPSCTTEEEEEEEGEGEGGGRRVGAEGE
jgi:hypothetical protein